MRYSLSVPSRALPAVRSALGVFDRVQVQVIEANPEPAVEGDDRVEVVRAELRLARPSSEPLAHLPLTPDPLQGFARVLARLDPAHRERAEVAIDLLPTTAATRRRLRRRLLKEALRRGDDSSRAARRRWRVRLRRRWWWAWSSSPGGNGQAARRARGDRGEAGAGRADLPSAGVDPLLLAGARDGRRLSSRAAVVFRRVRWRELAARRRCSLPRLGVRWLGPSWPPRLV